MAPSRRAPHRPGATLARPYNPPAQPPADVGDLSLLTLSRLEAQFVAKLPKGYLNDVSQQDRSALMRQCPDLNAHLLRRWWIQRQWEERRKVKQLSANASDQEQDRPARVSSPQSESASPSRAEEALKIILTPKKEAPSRFFESPELTRPTHDVHRPNAELVSPPQPPRDILTSPPHHRRSRPVLSYDTQPQQNSIGEQSAPVGRSEQVDPFASPPSRSTNHLTSNLTLAAEEIDDNIKARSSREQLLARILRLVDGAEEEQSQDQAFSLEDVHQLTRLGVNETDENIIFLCCSKVIIGDWTRVLDVRKPELMFYYVPSESCFRIWTAHEGQFYRISLPISALTSIKIFQSVDEVCISFTRNLLARPGISFAISRPLTLEWVTTPYDPSAKSQCSRCETWTVHARGSEAVISAIKEIARSEVHRASGDLTAGDRFLCKVWWGLWDSSTVKAEHLIECIDEPVSVEYERDQGGPSFPRKEPRITMMEFKHPFFPEVPIWCRAFLQDEELDENSAPASSSLASISTATDYRCPWLNGDEKRKVLTPWPNPTFAAPNVVADIERFNPTLAKFYSPSPEKSSQPSYRPSYHFNASSRLSRVTSSASKAFLGHSYSSPPSAGLGGSMSPPPGPFGECYDDELDCLLTAYTHVA